MVERAVRPGRLNLIDDKPAPDMTIKRVFIRSGDSTERIAPKGWRPLRDQVAGAVATREGLTVQPAPGCRRCRPASSAGISGRLQRLEEASHLSADIAGPLAHHLSGGEQSTRRIAGGFRGF